MTSRPFPGNVAPSGSTPILGIGAVRVLVRDIRPRKSLEEGQRAVEAPSKNISRLLFENAIIWKWNSMHS